MADLDAGGRVRAAGGLVWRHADGGPAAGAAVEVLVVHRPRYDDWSFPKGKCEPGEPFVAAALREVHEETGFEPDLGEALGEIRYDDHQGRPKVVRYWAMTVGGGPFRPNDEVDQVAWLSVDAAAARLSYSHDAELLRRAFP